MTTSKIVAPNSTSVGSGGSGPGRDLEHFERREPRRLGGGRRPIGLQPGGASNRSAVVIKRVTVVQAREGLDHTEALRYWKEVHAPIVARVPGLRRYVQNQCIAGSLGAGEPPFLGVGEVSFDTEEEAQKALATPEWKAVPDDAATFMDMSGVAAGWAQVHQIV